MQDVPYPPPRARAKVSREGTHCPYCGHMMFSSRNAGKHAKSRDHILPEAWGGNDTIHDVAGLPPTRNVRYCCKQCNERRGNCGHCVAVMTMIQMVATDSRSDWTAIYRAWRMYLPAAQVTRRALGYP